MFGASPRASINLILTARALAFVRGRDYALPQDVLDMALDVMRHRLVLSYEALSDNVSSDDILKKILDRIPIPVVPLREQRLNVRVAA
jgi:MoxR-like ATPase